MGACGSNSETAIQHQNNSIIVVKTHTPLQDVLDIQKRKERATKYEKKNVFVKVNYPSKTILNEDNQSIDFIIFSTTNQYISKRSLKIVFKNLQY
jgi:hypothetical protein